MTGTWWVICVVAALALGVVSWKVDLSSRPKGIGLVVSLCGLVVTLAIDQKFDMLALRGELRQAMEERQEVLLAQNEVLKDSFPVLQASQSDLLRPIVYGLVETHKSLMERESDVMLRVFGDRLEELARVWFPMHRGSFELGGEELALFSIWVVRNAHARVDATNYVDFGSWWETERGRQYLTANFEAVSRGIEIRRIFVFPSAEQCMAIERRLIEQGSRGVEVFIALDDWIPADSRADVLIVDNVIAGRMQLDGRRHSQGADIWNDSFNLQHTRDLFESALRVARPFEESRCAGLSAV